MMQNQVYRAPEHLLHQTNIKTFNEDEETLSYDVLKSNIQQVLSFNTKEIYIIEHLFGLNGRHTSEEIAANLKVTKVNITFTKHQGLSEC
jgi:DNA-directed RNA polymerase sigma subunit (sigma70/sigma32)